jgi:hypothetical protein
MIAFLFSSMGAATTSTAMTGKPIKNAEPHQKSWSKTPPTTGPMAVPASRQTAHRLMAVAHCAGCRNMVLIRPKAEGIRVAPAIPSSARAPISMPADVE